MNTTALDELAAMVGETRPFFCGTLGPTQMNFMLATDDTMKARAAVIAARGNGAAVNVYHWPEATAANVALSWPRLVVDLIVYNLFDDPDLSWWQRLGLNAAEIRPEGALE